MKIDWNRDCEGSLVAKKTDLTKGSPAKSLLLFAFPIILGNLFQQCYNMADSIIVGNVVGEDALAAVGASYALTTVFIMIAIGGGNGAAVLTSQYLGARQYGRMRTSISTALITLFAVSLVLGVVGLVANRQILIALDTPENILSLAGAYLKIYFVGLPFLFMYNVLTAIFNALGDSRTPLYLLIFSSVLNVALDLAAVIWWGLGVEGVAVATVMAQGVAACVSLGLLLYRLKDFEEEEDLRQSALNLVAKSEGAGMTECTGRIGCAGEGIQYGRNQVGERIRRGKCPAPVFDMEMMLRGTRIAIPTILQQSIVSIGMLLVQSVVNDFGSAALAGYAAASRVESISLVPMIATGNAVATFTAQNIGAGKQERVVQGHLAGCAIVAGFAAVIALVVGLFHETIVMAFLSEEPSSEALAVGSGYLSFTAWFTVLLGLKTCTDAVLRGSGDVLVFTLANLANLVIRVAAAFLLAPVIGVRAVWYVVPIGWLVNFLISFVRYRTGRWKEKSAIRGRG